MKAVWRAVLPKETTLWYVISSWRLPSASVYMRLVATPKVQIATPEGGDRNLESAVSP